MCFSLEASLTAGVALLPLGGYCAVRAVQVQPRLLVLAAIPLMFGFQQLSEAYVWWGLAHDDPAMVRNGACAFLFVALALWPFWCPLTAAVIGVRPGWRSASVLWVLASTFWFWALYLPFVLAPDGQFYVRVEHHSIYYGNDAVPIFEYVPRSALRILYFVCVAAPFALDRNALRASWPLALALVASVAVTILLFDHAFVSVWCFFAAVLSAYLAYVFYRLRPEGPPGEGPASAPALP